MALILTSFTSGLGAYGVAQEFLDVQTISTEKLESLKKDSNDLLDAKQEIQQMKVEESKKKWRVALACLKNFDLKESKEVPGQNELMFNREKIFTALCTIRSLSIDKPFNDSCDRVLENIARSRHDWSPAVHYDVPVSAIDRDVLEGIVDRIEQEAIQHGVQ